VTATTSATAAALVNAEVVRTHDKLQLHIDTVTGTRAATADKARFFPRPALRLRLYSSAPAIQKRHLPVI
jgi:hypothetical protein